MNLLYGKLTVFFFFAHRAREACAMHMQQSMVFVLHTLHEVILRKKPDCLAVLDSHG